MSKPPARRAAKDRALGGSRSFQRRLKSERARAAQRQATRRRVRLTQAGSRVDLRAALARAPAAAWACALVALLNGVAWSIVTPPFQGRDEPAHFAYVQLLAEARMLPRLEAEQTGYSPEESSVLEGLHQEAIKLSPEVPAISSVGEQQALMGKAGKGLSPVGSGEAGVATSEPPLYYAIEVIPYALGGGNTLAQLELMRLMGALLAAITTLLSFFFLREALPGVPWAATVGTACVAVQPLFGFMSGTVNPDTMLYVVSAALLLCLARGFRRGLSRPLALTTGVLIAVGFLTKLTFLGLALGAFAGLILLSVREARARGREPLRSLAIAAAIAAAPVLLYVVVNWLSNHQALGSAPTAALNSSKDSVVDEISYVWELYLPRLPGMAHYFVGVSTFHDIWLTRMVGLYGWIDTELPSWVTNLALAFASAIVLLCCRELVVRREALRVRLPELAIYGAMGIGVLILVGAASYSSWIVTGGVEGFGDPRYLLPMLPLLGAAITLAVRGAGRWAPAVGVLILIAFLAHDLFSQLQVIARYYG